MKTGYLRSLHSPKIFITKDPIVEIIPEGVRTASQTYPADIIIAATGFDTSRSLMQNVIRGRNGQSIHDYWKKTQVLTAYHTTSMPGCKRFFGFIVCSFNWPYQHCLNYLSQFPIFSSSSVLTVGLDTQARS